MRIDTVPNRITGARLVLSVGLFWILACGPSAGSDAARWAFAAFLVAAATDFLDGWLARRTGTESALGRILDPVVDKMLIIGSLILVMGLDPAPPIAGWMIVVVLLRELLVTSLRGAAETAGKAFPADKLGKAKMVLQCVVVGLVLFQQGWPGTLAGFTEPLVWAMLTVTLLSGFNYVLRAHKVLSG